jgi:hypothetical protein
MLLAKNRRLQPPLRDVELTVDARAENPQEVQMKRSQWTRARRAWVALMTIHSINISVYYTYCQ